MSSHRPLQAFQARLNEALTNPATETEAFIAVRAGGAGWLLSMGDLLETSAAPLWARTGRMPVGVLGIGPFRGRVHTLLDMRHVLGGAPTHAPTPGQGWTTVLHPRFGAPLALWWPDLSGMMPRSLLRLHPAASKPSLAASAWTDDDANGWYGFDVAALLASGWSDVAWEGAA